MVEYEQAVGRALATEEDPDYDVMDNKLYTGEQKIMIRPYPLPSTVKVICFRLQAANFPLGDTPKTTC